MIKKRNYDYLSFFFSFFFLVVEDIINNSFIVNISFPLIKLNRLYGISFSSFTKSNFFKYIHFIFDDDYVIFKKVLPIMKYFIIHKLR